MNMSDYFSPFFIFQFYSLGSFHFKEASHLFHRLSNVRGSRPLYTCTPTSDAETGMQEVEAPPEISGSRLVFGLLDPRYIYEHTKLRTLCLSIESQSSFRWQI